MSAGSREHASDVPAGPGASEWDSVLDKVTCLPGKPYQVEVLTGGLTNINLKVSHAEGAVVVRIAQPGSELLAIDRKAEHLNSTAAAQAGVGAPVLEYIADPGLLVVGFIDGRAFTDDDIRGGAHLSRIAAACRQLHGGPRFVSDFNMFDIQRGYLDIVQREGFRLPARYLDFIPQAAGIESAFHSHPQPTVPCNNDLLAGNFIDDGRKIWLIDYEYSGNNDPCFELGNIWSEANLSLEQLEELMEAYDGRLLRHRVARARLWGLMSKFGWTLWGSIQASVSSIDFDFWEWAMEKYERAAAEFDGPAFTRLLDDAAAGGPDTTMSL
jgi:thiamine kinase-like enzyme